MCLLRFLDILLKKSQFALIKDISNILKMIKWNLNEIFYYNWMDNF